MSEVRLEPHVVTDWRGKFHWNRYGGVGNTNLPGSKKYTIHQTPQSWFGFCESKGRWWIPRDGLHSDQGSIPLIGQVLARVTDDAYKGFYCHDDGYQFGSRLEYEIGPDGLPDLTRLLGVVPVSRAEVDTMLLEAMTAEDRLTREHWLIQRQIIYRNVRLFGGLAWRHDAAMRRKRMEDV